MRSDRGVCCSAKKSWQVVDRICTSGIQTKTSPYSDDIFRFHYRYASIGLDTRCIGKRESFYRNQYCWGMLTGVLLGIFIIPVLYVIFQYLHEKCQARKTQSTSERISSSTFCFTLKLFNRHAKNTSNISGSSTGRNCGFV